MTSFKYDLGAKVELKLSGEKGEVAGRAEYLYDENLYWVRYLAADGCQKEDWWRESALK
jgi:hypothetical protein